MQGYIFAEVHKKVFVVFGSGRISFRLAHEISIDR